MSLSFVIGLAAAAMVESFFLGGLLLYLSARCWKTPVGLGRAVGLCFALMATSTAGSVLSLLVSRSLASANFQIALALMIGLGATLLQWYWAKRILRTGVLLALAVWLSAWTPLLLTNVALALITKTVFTEAYTMPTGSMAPTVLGKHGDRLCANCGCEFAVSVVDWLPRGTNSPAKKHALKTSCPNCREPHTVDTTAEILSGDRFLVDNRSRPHRWSLVAHRQPPSREEVHLKRLVGLPGETVELVGGEVFINGELLRKQPDIATDLWLPLHDTALAPKTFRADTPRWRPGGDQSRWHETGGGWTVDSIEGNRASLNFFGAITDRLAYNTFDALESDSFEETLTGDVLMTCEMGAFGGPGEFTFEWEFRGSTVQCNVNANGELSIEAQTAWGGRDWERIHAAGRLSSAIVPGDQLGFAIRDGQAYVQVNEQVAALLMFVPSNVEAYRDQDLVEAEACRLSIVADDCSATLNRITIQRDVYYLGREMRDPRGYGSSGQPVELGETECFMLGDNSVRSLDSRMQRDVQADDILGIARWIYWPKKRWHEFR